MSTNNFKYENILVVTPDFTFKNVCLDEECENFEKEEGEVKNKCEHMEDDFDTEGFKMYCDEMREYLGKIRVAKNINYCNMDESDNDRSYEGLIIGEFQVMDKNGDEYKRVYLVIKNGYYSGTNIDYIIDDPYSCDSLTKAQEKKLEEQVNGLCEKIEKILVKYGGEEYLKVGQFSNGEALYQKKSIKSIIKVL